MVVGKGIAIICSECIAGAAAVLARSTLASVRLTEMALPAIGALDPVFRAFADGDISLGRVHEIVRDWQDGRPFDLPKDPTHGG